MKDFIKKIFTIVSILLLIQNCELDKPTGFIIGQVIDDTYKPISKARIEIAGITSSTNDEGQYYLKDIPIGKHRLRVIYEGTVTEYRVAIKSDSIHTLNISLSTKSKTKYYNSFGKENYLILTSYDVLYVSPSPKNNSLALEVFGGSTYGSAIWEVDNKGMFLNIIQDEGFDGVNYEKWLPEYSGYTVYEGNPTWLSNGREMLFQTYIYKNGKRRHYHIWWINLTNRQKKIIDRGFTPNVSKDSKCVVYSKVTYDKSGNLNWDIWQYNFDYEGKHFRLTKSKIKEQYPSWAYIKGKEYILYSAQSTIGYYDIWKMKADGSEQTQLTSIGQNNKTSALGAMVSPDGKKIVFWSANLGRGDSETNEKIWIMNSDGSNLKMLVEGGANPVWSSDGKFIYFVANKTWRWQVWRLEVDEENYK